MLAEGRLLAVRAVRLLHRARRRQGGRQLQPVAREGRGRDDHHARGLARRASATAWRRAFAATGALQCGFCTPGILVRVDVAARQEGRRPRPRHRGPPPRRPPLPLHRLREDPRRGRAAREGRDAASRAAARRHRHERHAATRASSSRSATSPTSTTCASPGMLHGALRLADHARADVRAHRHQPRRPRCPASCAVFTAADVPGELRVGLIHKDWPVFIPEGGRTSYLGDVLAHRRGRRPRDRAARGRAGRGRVRRRCAPITDPGRRASTTDEDAVWGLDGNVLSRSAYARGDVDAALARERARRARGVPDPAHRARVPRARVDARRARSADGAPARVLGRPGRVGRPRPDRVGARRSTPTRITVELVSNGGAFGGKEDMANQAQTALAAWLLRPPGEVHAVARGVAAHPPQAPPDPHGVLRSAATPTAASPRCGPAWSATRVRTRRSGMKVLERAAGHASGPYRVPAIDVEAVAARTNNPVCGAFRGFGANQAQFAMEGVLDRLAEQVGISGWEIRRRNVITPGDVWGPGQIMDDGCRGARRCLDAVQARTTRPRVAAGKAVGLGLGLKNSGLGNGFKEIARAVVRFERRRHRRGAPLLDRDGPGRAHGRRCRSRSRSSASTPSASGSSSTPRASSAPARPPGQRGTLMGAGAVADACRAARADGCRVGVDYEGEYRVDWTELDRAGVEQPDHPLRVRLRRAAGGHRPRDGRDRAGRRRARRRAGGQPAAVRGPDRGRGAHGPRLRAAPRTSRADDRRPAHEHDPARPRHHPAQGHAADRGDPRRGARSRASPYGIKGVGEIGLVPTAGAVAAALHDLDGEWRTDAARCGRPARDGLTPRPSDD